MAAKMHGVLVSALEMRVRGIVLTAAVGDVVTRNSGIRSYCSKPDVQSNGAACESFNDLEDSVFDHEALTTQSQIAGGGVGAVWRQVIRNRILRE